MVYVPIFLWYHHFGEYCKLHPVISVVGTVESKEDMPSGSYMFQTIHVHTKPMHMYHYFTPHVPYLQW